MKAEIRIGVSGWRFAPWRGGFYPKGLVQARELEYASRVLSAIEINGSFYALQTPGRFANWAAATPQDFSFTVKAPRYITHTLQLENPELPMANFLASGLFELGDKLGAVLWQFPPGMQFDSVQFETFLTLLPHSAATAEALASRREQWMHGKELIKPRSGFPMRHAVEIRNQSFVNPAFIALLRKYKVAMVIADTGGRWPEYEDLTADFVYMRLHGASELYKSGYSEAQLYRWAERIGLWSRGDEPGDARLISSVQATKKMARDVFCFFDNTAKLEAPNNARRLMHKLGLPEGPGVVILKK